MNNTIYVKRYSIVENKPNIRHLQNGNIINTSNWFRKMPTIMKKNDMFYSKKSAKKYMQFLKLNEHGQYKIRKYHKKISHINLLYLHKIASQLYKINGKFDSIKNITIKKIKFINK